MYIDPHVHCRDWNEEYKDTIEHTLRVAEKSGLTAIFDMPNTKPPLITKELVLKRLELADEADSPVFYATYMGLTLNELQIEEAVKTYNEFFPRVIGFKFFTCSAGELGVTDEKDQLLIYKTLTNLRYEGVLCVHCEKESLLKPYIWDPKNPITHTSARPEEAEFNSIEDQIKLKIKSDFKGNLHIAHISTPESVFLIENYIEEGLNISCELTPHHALLNKEIMNQKNGLLYKMNPPLRDEWCTDILLDNLKNGKIPMIGSDHAPHKLEEKLFSPYLSGIPNLPFYPKFIEILRKKGFSEKIIREITFDNICKIFKIELKPRQVEVSTEEDLYEWGNYSFNPYKNIKCE